MKTIIEMAREAGLGDMGQKCGFIFLQSGKEGLERFAALVREDLQKEFDELQAMYIQQGLNYKRDMDEREKQQEPVAWMWACTECGTEAEDGTDCRICSSCGYHKFYKAPKVATCVCAAKTQEQAEQEPVAWVDLDESGDAFLTIKDCGIPLYTTPPTAALAAKQMRDAAVKVCEDIERKRWETMMHGGNLVGWTPKDVAEAIAALPILGEEK